MGDFWAEMNVPLSFPCIHLLLPPTAWRYPYTTVSDCIVPVVQNVDYHICSYLFPTNVFRTLLMFLELLICHLHKTVSWPCIHTSLEMAFVQLMKKKSSMELC